MIIKWMKLKRNFDYKMIVLQNQHITLVSSNLR